MILRERPGIPGQHGAAEIELAIADPRQLLRDATTVPLGGDALDPEAAAFIAAEARRRPSRARLRVDVLLPAPWPPGRMPRASPPPSHPISDGRPRRPARRSGSCSATAA